MTISFPKSSHHSGLRYMKRNPHPQKELIRDCGVRAICLAFDQDYEKVFKLATTNKRYHARDNSYWSVAAQDYIYRTTPDAGKGLNKEDLLIFESIAIKSLSRLGYNLLNTKRNLLTKFSDLDIERFKKINSELKENVIKNANKTDLILREPHENFKKKILASKTF